MKKRVLLLLLAVFSVGVLGPTSALAEGVPEPDPGPAIARCKTDMAARLGISSEEIEVVGVEREAWSSGCLGCPADGENCTEAVVFGWKITLRDGGWVFEYHTNGLSRNYMVGGWISETPKYIRLCGKKELKLKSATKIWDWFRVHDDVPSNGRACIAWIDGLGRVNPTGICRDFLNTHADFYVEKSIMDTLVAEIFGPDGTHVGWFPTTPVLP